MNIEDTYHKQFKPWLKKKGYYKFGHFGYSSSYNYIRVRTNSFKLWKKLRKVYNEEELIEYFIEVVRKELPELKGTRIYFTDKPLRMNSNHKLPNRIV